MKEMVRKVLVPLATRKLKDSDKTSVHFAREMYIQKLVQNELAPVFVSALMSPDMQQALYRECAGALFMGGGDFDAKYYGETNDKFNDRAEPERDEMELSLLALILKDKKPFLGICRGCQALAIASGGTLHQHIPNLKLGENHNSRAYEDMASKNFHEIRLEEGSKLRSIFGSDVLSVNSGHHQAVKTLGPDFAITARTAGGIIEAIEHRDPDYFCIGIQSHPEMMPPGRTDRLFAEFAKAVAKGKR